MRIRIVITVMTSLFIVLPTYVNAQQNQKKPKKVFQCGCIITRYKHKCGVCGGTLECDLKSRRRLPNGFSVYNYICHKDHQGPNTPHIHKNISDENDYVHKCREERCIKTSMTTKANGEVEWSFTNICQVRTCYNLTISDGNTHAYIKSLRPGSTEKCPVAFPKTAKLIITIQPQEDFDLLRNY